MPTTEEGAMLGDILRKLIQRGTGQNEAINRTAEREKLIQQGASPADIFASEDARREQALARQNVLGGIGARFPGLAKAPVIGGVFSPGTPLEAPARTQKETLAANAERRAEEANVRADEAGGRAKEKLPYEVGVLKAQAAHLEQQKAEDALKHIPAETAQQLLAAKEAGAPITIAQAIDKRRDYEAQLAAARKDTPETRRAAVDLKRNTGAVKRAENALKAAVPQAMQGIPAEQLTPEIRSKLEKAQADLAEAIKKADDSSEALKATYGGGKTAAPAPAPAPAGQAAVAPAAATAAAAEKVKVEKDGKQFMLPASQLDEAVKQGYKKVE